MRILALDIATKCGFAYGDLENLVSGSWDFSSKRDESKGMRLVKFERELNRLREVGIDRVVFEQAAGFHKAPLITCAEMHGVLKKFCEKAGIDYCSLPSTSVKLYATGKGKASKDEMLNAAIHKFGVDCGGDHDQADALAIWHMHYASYGDGDGIEPTQPVLKQRKPKAKGVKRKAEPTPA